VTGRLATGSAKVIAEAPSRDLKADTMLTTGVMTDQLLHGERPARSTSTRIVCVERMTEYYSDVTTLYA